MKTSLAKKSLWKKHIAQQSVSNLSRAAYCVRHGLKLHQFNYHFKRLREVSEPPSGFAKLIVKEDSYHPPAIPLATLVLSSGSRFALWMHKLEKETFRWPRKMEGDTISLSPKELTWLLDGLDISRMKPSHLPEVQNNIDLPEEEKFCPKSGAALKNIGSEVSK